MPNFNSVELMGNITNEMEVRYASSGAAILNFSLAINRKYTKDNKQIQETDFFDVTAFGKLAESIALFAGKGDCLFVEGRLKQERWEHGGNKYQKVVVILEGFQFIRTKKGNKNAEREPEEESEHAPF